MSKVETEALTCPSVLQPFERDDLAESFASAPIQMLHLVKHLAALSWPLEERWREALTRSAHCLVTVPREALFVTLTELLTGENVKQALGYLAQTELLDVLLPEVQRTIGFAQKAALHNKDLWEHIIQVCAQAEPRPAVRWAALLHDVGKVGTRRIETNKQGTKEIRFLHHEEWGALLTEGIAARLCFPEALRERVVFLVRHHSRANAYQDEWSDAAVRRLRKEAGEHLEDLLALSAADVTSARASVRLAVAQKVAALRTRLRDLAQQEERNRPLLPSGIGQVIMEVCGLSPGPTVGVWKRKLLAAIKEGELAPHQTEGVYREWLSTQQET